MKTPARLVAAAMLVAASLTASSVGVADMPGHRMIHSNDLKWADVPSLPPGAKIAVIEGPMTEAVPFTIRLKFPANYTIPAHSHPAVERVTVLSGTFHMGVGEKIDTEKTMPLHAGDMMIMQPKVNHYAWNRDEVVVQLNGMGPWGVTYVNPADDPRKK